MKMKVSVTQLEGARLSVKAGEGFEVIVDRDAADGSKQGFRPVELLLGALGACTVGTMLTFAEGQHLELRGVSVELEAESASRPERVSEISLTIDLPSYLDAEAAAQLVRVGKHCKIHNTLKREPAVTVDLGRRMAVRDGTLSAADAALRD